MTEELTHFNLEKRAKMVDVSQKQVTAREAKAIATIKMNPETLQRIKEGQVKKGDVLAVAQTAGIMAAKQTSNLIPMCHLLPLKSVDLSFSDNGLDTLAITSMVKVLDQTGVEMEALMACNLAALTVYDMCKAMDRSMTIEQVHVLEKKGGKSGHFIYEKNKG